MAPWKAHAYVALVVALPPLLAYLRPHTPVRAAVFIIIYGWLLKTIAYPFYFGPLRHLPSPAGDKFALGHGRMLLLAANANPPGSTLLPAIKATANQGLVLLRGVFFLVSPVVLTTPEALSEVLNTKSYDYEKPSLARKFLSRVIGDGLVVVEGKEHKRQRKAVTPAFQGRQINSLVPIFWSKACEFVDTIVAELKTDNLSVSAKAAGFLGTIEIGDLASRVTLDIIGVASIGRDFGSLQNAGDELAVSYATLFDRTNRRKLLYRAMTLFVPKEIARYIMPGTSKLVEGTISNIRESAKSFLAEKRALVAEKNLKPNDILSTLLNFGSFTDDELVDQLLTFLAAGHETTASALTWACYMLCMNPDVQTKLRAEIQANAASLTDEGVTSDVFDRLPYLNGVVMETLRLWATVPVTARIAIRKTSIGSTVIPKGTQLMIAPMIVNRLESLWGPDAEQFVPDRWCREDGNMHGGAASAFSLVTFLHGPRSCIGQGFAKAELRCLLAALVKRFEIELADPLAPVKPVGMVTIKPKGGLNLRLREVAATK